MHRRLSRICSLACLLLPLMCGCSFDSISIGFVDPNDDDGFGGYVPAHERARLEMQVWERPEDQEESEESSATDDPPADEYR